MRQAGWKSTYRRDTFDANELMFWYAIRYTPSIYLEPRLQ
jgi:hypothetical protein